MSINIFTISHSIMIKLKVLETKVIDKFIFVGKINFKMAAAEMRGNNCDITLTFIPVRLS